MEKHRIIQQTEQRLGTNAESLGDRYDIAPEQARRIMDQRAHELARVPHESRSTREREIISFRLGNESFAIESAYVREVFKMASCVSIPGSPSFLVGVTNLRGEVLAVMDLREFFSIQDDIGQDAWVLVLGGNHPEFGVIADSVETVTMCEMDSLFEAPQSVTGQGCEYVKGITHDCVLILDGEALLQDDRLYVDQD